MANVYYAQAKYPEALKLHEDVLAIRVAKLGLEHPLAAGTMMGIGSVLYCQGKFPEAQEMYEQAVAIQ